jgi:hypothetical protein
MKFYEPTEYGKEKALKERMAGLEIISAQTPQR